MHWAPLKMNLVKTNSYFSHYKRGLVHIMFFLKENLSEYFGDSIKMFIVVPSDIQFCKDYYLNNKILLPFRFNFIFVFE